MNYHNWPPKSYQEPALLSNDEMHSIIIAPTLNEIRQLIPDEFSFFEGFFSVWLDAMFGWSEFAFDEHYKESMESWCIKSFMDEELSLILLTLHQYEKMEQLIQQRYHLVKEPKQLALNLVDWLSDIAAKNKCSSLNELKQKTMHAMIQIGFELGWRYRYSSAEEIKSLLGATYQGNLNDVRWLVLHLSKLWIGQRFFQASRHLLMFGYQGTALYHTILETDWTTVNNTDDFQKLIDRFYNPFDAEELALGAQLFLGLAR